MLQTCRANTQTESGQGRDVGGGGTRFSPLTVHEAHVVCHDMAQSLALAALTSSGSLRLARMLPFSPGACLLGLLSRGDVSSGGGGGGGGGATFSLLGEMVSSNHNPRMGSLSSSASSRAREEKGGTYTKKKKKKKTQLPDSTIHDHHNTSHSQPEPSHPYIYIYKYI